MIAENHSEQQRPKRLIALVLYQTLPLFVHLLCYVDFFSLQICFNIYMHIIAV